MTRPQDAATEALAEAIAEERGRLAMMRGNQHTWNESFIAAAAVEEYLKRRGYVIRKARKSG